MTELPHILVVDDHREIRESVTRYLERNGMRATAACDAVDMDAKLATGQFDLIVLDVMMPGEDGLSACRRLSARGSAPILMLTALGEDTDRIVGLEIGADDYLAKRCCHINSFVPGRVRALGMSGDAGRHFPGIERFEPMVTDSEGGASAGRNGEAIAGCRLHRDEAL